MWLLPVFSAVARTATRVYYRLRIGGGPVPPEGPALLFANHPNSLLDPALVVAAARRPVRFLAKAPLFTDPLVGWLVRGSGSIPVYRRQDDPERMEQNRDAFSAAHEALAEGAAVGIFPEGMSHDEPSLAPFRTGAARIALSAALRTGGAFPLVPVGLVFRRKDVFRSQARVTIGTPVMWDDLAAAGDAPEAVRELTARMEEALRTVTLNLERWEDEPLVEMAWKVWSAEFGPPASDAERMLRLREGTRRLAELRQAADDRWEGLARDLSRHGRLLAKMGLSPAGLKGDPGVGEAARWTLVRLPVVTPLALFFGIVGAVVFWPPYRVTGWITGRMKPDPDVVATTKLLTGIPTYLAWILILAAGVWIAAGPVWGVVAAVLLPVFALVTLDMRERWRENLRIVRLFFVKRGRADRVGELRARQQELAERLAQVMAPAELP
jgi:glycerol-3-phosphate O-acyltransferase / dihydroxyacetone phosphate acyltransferase